MMSWFVFFQFSHLLFYFCRLCAHVSWIAFHCLSLSIFPPFLLLTCAPLAFSSCVCNASFQPTQSLNISTCELGNINPDFKKRQFSDATQQWRHPRERDRMSAYTTEYVLVSKNRKFSIKLQRCLLPHVYFFLLCFCWGCNSVYMCQGNKEIPTSDVV